MAKTIYTGIAGVARKVKQPYVGVAGVARKVKAGYLGVGGVARQFFAGGIPLSTLAVGTSVYLKISGTAKEFFVIHQGRPSITYDTSCDGTWLLMKDCYTNRAFDSADHDYANSDIHTYLNGTFYNSIDSTVRSAIKNVKIPYRAGVTPSVTVETGSSGLSTKVFLLSATEVGFSNEGWCPVEGSKLSYFPSGNSTNRSLRIANYGGNAVYWWLRSPSGHPGDYAETNYYEWIYQVGDTGSVSTTFNVTQNSYVYVRPALIFPSTQLVDASYNIIA